MRPPTRRLALTALACLLLLVAGCAAPGGGSGDADTGLLVANQDAADHAVVVEVYDDAREVYDDGTTVDGESTVELDAVGETGTFEVRVTVDGETTTLSYEFTDDDRKTTIGIADDGTVTVGG